MDASNEAIIVLSNLTKKRSIGHNHRLKSFRSKFPFADLGFVKLSNVCFCLYFPHRLTFGEDFHFDIPKLFRYLNVYLYQSQRTLCNSVLSRALGKVVIPYNELRDPILREDQWLPLLPMNAVADVQGKVNLSADCQWDSSINELVFTINIAKCQDIWTYPCDSFACIKLKDDRGVNTFKTKIVKKTTNPEFHETFRLNVIEFYIEHANVYSNEFVYFLNS